MNGRRRRRRSIHENELNGILLCAIESAEMCVRICDGCAWEIIPSTRGHICTVVLWTNREGGLCGWWGEEEVSEKSDAISTHTVAHLERI